MTTHASLTGADLHEPKGIASAANGTIYVANGSGSGSWLQASSVVTNSAWTTGDVKLSYNAAPASGWVNMNDGTIGDGSSGATTRANADTQALFTLMWGFANAGVSGMTVSGGIGASAAADFAAHKTVTLPKMLGRALVSAGSGSGLTARTLAAIFGEENHLLTIGEMPNHGHTAVVNDPGHAHAFSGPPNFWYSGGGTNIGGSPNTSFLNYGAAGVVNSNTTGITVAIQGQGGGATHNNMQPSSFINVQIKL